MKKHIIALISAIAAAGCSTTIELDYTTKSRGFGEVRKIALFFDGTANDAGTRTNLSRLFELVANQKRTDLALFYTEGVGTDNRVIGMLTGWGIGWDVRQAYRFLIRQQAGQPHDALYLFGFSRGAYAARILAGLVEVAGVPDFPCKSGKATLRTDPHCAVDERQLETFVNEIYAAYKGDEEHPGQRVVRVNSAFGNRPRVYPEVKVVGLWDTIESLGIRGMVHKCTQNRRYVTQLCSAKRVYHAVALDDNREESYCPVILATQERKDECKEHAGILEEVYFSGAHADVGGGYDEKEIAGLSLNWMLGREHVGDIVPAGSQVIEGHRGIVHDGQGSNFAYRIVFDREDRDLNNYREKMPIPEPKRLKIHGSTIDRLAEIKVIRRNEDHRSQESGTHQISYDARTTESGKYDGWFQRDPFAACFEETSKGFTLCSGCKHIEVVSPVVSKPVDCTSTATPEAPTAE